MESDVQTFGVIVGVTAGTEFTGCTGCVKLRTESYFSSWIVRQRFEMPTSSLLCFFCPPPHPPDKCGCVHTHTHTHTHTNTHTHGTPSCQYSMCSNMESLTAGQLLPRMSEWSSALSSVDVHRRMLFCLCLEVRLAGCCWDHANLPVKKFYKIGFTHQICGASVSWCPHDSIESSGLSCPLRCQLHRTSALQVEIAGMQMILYLPYNILSALLYLSQFT